jgi:predicted transcriptional regulator
MKRDLQGWRIPVSTVGEPVEAFVPAPLPPSPSIEWSAELREKFDQALLERPMASPKWIQKKTQLSAATVNACLRELENLGVVQEVTGQKRNRIYSYV